MRALAFLLFLQGVTACLPAVASVCPQKVVRMLVGFPPGGSTDMVARIIAPPLGEFFHQQFIIDNRPGAGGDIATEMAARARPDGCTLLVVSAAFSSNISVFTRASYDPLRQFSPVARVAILTNVLVVHPSLPVHRVHDLVAFAKARPGEISLATLGVGSTSQLALKLLKRRVGGLNVLEVPYKGAALAVLDLLAGEVDGFFATSPIVTSHIRSGRLRALAVASLRRSTVLPDVPTFTEEGYRGFEAPAWVGIVAPAGTAYDNIVRLDVALAQVVKAPEVKGRFALQGAEPVGDTAEQFRTYLRLEVEKWSRVMNVMGARVN